MKYLGIDYGDKRVGIAVSDPEGKIAFPKSTLFNNPRLIENLKRLIKEEKISKIVVGLPLTLDKSETEQSGKTRVFAKNLKNAVNITVDFENEMLTTRLVERAGIKKERIDESSAALILQSCLDKTLDKRLTTKD